MGALPEIYRTTQFGAEGIEGFGKALSMGYSPEPEG
jgi:hypothetical protein